MKQFLSKVSRPIMLAGVWLLLILPAKNHFNVSLFNRVKYAVLGGFMPDQYALYNLKDKKNRKLYLSEFDWYRSRYINEPFDRMLDNKIICTEVLHHFIKVPEIYFLKNKGKMTLFPKGKTDSFEDQNRWASAEDVIGLLDEHGALFVKPLAEGKGNGVCRIEKKRKPQNLDESDAAHGGEGNAINGTNATNDGATATNGGVDDTNGGVNDTNDVAGADCNGASEVYLIDDKEVDESSLIKYLNERNNYFICQGISQCEYLNNLYDKTTNTIRFITLKDPESGEFKVFFAVQRIGTKATIPVDNGSKGGLVAKIDLETGELSEAQSLHSLTRYKVHPDSHNPIEGVVVPNWDSIKEQMLELASRFPYLNFVAWDILIDSQNEICVIEANKSSGVNIIQLWGPQKQGELGDFFRFHGAIK